MALVSLHLAARAGHGWAHVAGQTTAARGNRYPGISLQYVSITSFVASSLILSASQAQSLLTLFASVKVVVVISGHDCSDRWLLLWAVTIVCSSFVLWDRSDPAALTVGNDGAKRQIQHDSHTASRYPRPLFIRSNAPILLIPRYAMRCTL